MAEQTKIQSREMFAQYKENAKKKLTDNTDQTVIAVGMATCGVAAGAGEVMDALRDELQKSGIEKVSLIETGCYGFCYAEPMVEVREPGAPGVKYGYVDEEMARTIVRKHIAKGELLDNAIIGQEVQKP